MAVLGQRGLEGESRIDLASGHGSAEWLEVRPDCGRRLNDLTNPAADQPGRDRDDGTIQQGPTIRAEMLELGHASRPVRPLGLTQRLPDDAEQRSPLRVLGAKCG
jgi:hypothetical protein